MIICGYLPDKYWIQEYIGLETVLNNEITIFTTDDDTAEKASKKFKKIYLGKLKRFEINSITPILKRIVEEVSPDIFITPSTNKGRAVAGLYMGLTGVDGVSDTVEIELSNRRVSVQRLVYGGTGKASISLELPCVISITPGYFKGEKEDIDGEIISLGEYNELIHVEYRPRETTGLDPTKAETVVVAGRGIKERKDLDMIIKLAEIMGGAWSVTRPLAADYGWTDNWIGISGLIISPKYYIGVGVSGQPHHMMGARNSKVVIAINKDPNAPIFEEADYGIIGDLYKILPKLIERLKER